jgi:hypothetical protein
MSKRYRGSALIAALVIGLALATLAWNVMAQSTSEQDLMRAIKEDVFEERWDSVLAGAEKVIADFPQSPSLARTMYYKARALHKLGRGNEAVDAYGDFIKKFPNETLLREDALISRMGLAKGMVLDGRKDQIRPLLDGLQEKGYPKIYAAIQISFLDNRPGQKQALPVLKECAEGESDAEVRNECTLAILRISPTNVPSIPNQVAAPPDAPRPPEAPTPPGAPGEPKLIRLQVRDKVTEKVTVAVNLPIAFAEALLQSLGEIEQGEIVRELQARGYDINNLWKSLKTLGKQTLVEIETEDARIKVWLE